MDSVANELNNIKRTLEKQNEIVQNMLNIMQKPENKFTRVLQMLVLIIGVLGIANIIDIIRNWVLGGD